MLSSVLIFRLSSLSAQTKHGTSAPFRGKHKVGLNDIGIFYFHHQWLSSVHFYYKVFNQVRIFCISAVLIYNGVIHLHLHS